MWASISGLRQPVYPRTGGGNRLNSPQPSAGGGLSPHGRGKPAPGKSRPAASRSIPARAGETQNPGKSAAELRVYPRTGGGNQTAGELGLRFEGLSPHGRGKLAKETVSVFHKRSIPARAGETGTADKPKYAPPVYPRTGGGNTNSGASARRSNGLSPHGRGKPLPPHCLATPLRSIPARAGETDYDTCS